MSLPSSEVSELRLKPSSLVHMYAVCIACATE